LELFNTYDKISALSETSPLLCRENPVISSFPAAASNGV
jgi:hypothetical protein